MQAAVERLGAGPAFVGGDYQNLFYKANGYMVAGTEQAWARTYVRNREALEAAAAEAYNTSGLSFEPTRRLVLYLAGKHTGKTVARAVTGIIPAFEDFLERNAPGQLSVRADLATTARQVEYMQAALDAVGAWFPSLTALNHAENAEDYMLIALTWALFPNRAITDHIIDDRAAEYQAVARRWLGRSYGTTLSAIRLAQAGATLSDLQAFAKAGLPFEYALTLTSSPTEQ